MTNGEIIQLAARSQRAVEEPDLRYKAALVMIDIIRKHLDGLIVDMTRERDNAARGETLRADFRASCKHLERALDALDQSTERLVRL